jgi:hypothetical protein
MIDDDRKVLTKILTGNESWCMIQKQNVRFLTWLRPNKPKNSESENAKFGSGNNVESRLLC